MNTAAAALPRKPFPLLLAATLAVAVLLLLYFLQKKLHFYVDFTAESFSPYFWPRRAGFIPHIFGGLLAVAAGIAQLWLGLTNRTGPLHRKLGWVYVTGVTIGVLGGIYLVATVPGNRIVYASGLGFLSVAWVLTTGMAIWAIRNRHYNQHRDWMLRSYVVSFAFVAFRVGADSLAANSSLNAGQISDIMAWACWAVPLLIAEPFIQLRAVKRRG